MSEYTFQEILVRFLLEKEIRDAVYSNDEVLQAKLNLVPEHVARLSQISPERVDVFSKTIEYKRLKQLTRQLPLTCKILGKSLHKLALDFFPGEPMDGKDQFKYSLDFGDFLINQTDLASFPAYLIDVLEYEMNKLKLRSQVGELNLSGKAKQKSRIFFDQFVNDEIFLNVVFVPTLNHKIFNLSCNVFEVVKQLLANQKPNPTNSKGIYGLVYVNEKEELAGCILNSSTVNFIRACNGKTKLSSIAQNLLGVNNTNLESYNKAMHECIELSKSLYKLEIIEVS